VNSGRPERIVLAWAISSASPNPKADRISAGSGTTCTRANGTFACTIRVRRVGSMRMPVVVAARFADGSEPRARTDRLVDVAEVTFRANAPLKEAVIDPDGLLPLSGQHP